MFILSHNYVHIAVILRGDKFEAKIPEDVAAKSGKLQSFIFIGVALLLRGFLALPR